MFRCEEMKKKTSAEFWISKHSLNACIDSIKKGKKYFEISELTFSEFPLYYFAHSFTTLR